MKSDDKLLAIFVVCIFIGGLGSLVAGWIALSFAAVAIAAIAFSKNKEDGRED